MTEDLTNPSSPAPAWGKLADLARFPTVPGIWMRSFVGSAVMANWVTIEPGAAVPLHDHPHEQLGIMLEGEMDLTIGDETRTIGPGDLYVVPPHVTHGARSTEGCLVVDIFTPVREDYAALAREATARA
jgi:quercetin dioxygenase-like cupin family protein